ncbi:MAG: HEPN domain-containing protein [Pseudomonadota bacterium]
MGLWGPSVSTANNAPTKYVKALLTLRSIPFPKSHDVPNLFQLARKNAELDIELGEVSLIDRYAVEARYPGDWEPIARTDAEEALAIARKVRAAIRALLPTGILYPEG